MKNWFIFSAVFAGVTAVAVLSYNAGAASVYRTEFKTYQACLAVFDRGESGDSTLKELLKLKYYYFAKHVPDDWLDQSAKDYGSVDTEVAKLFGMRKDVSAPAEDYDEFRRRKR